MGHDLNHPGLGNTYFMKADHVLSETVNGFSVLENFHAYTLFRILAESKLLQELGHEKRQKLFPILKELILCTDMAKHDAVTKDIKTITDKILASPD